MFEQGLYSCFFSTGISVTAQYQQIQSKEEDLQDWCGRVPGTKPITNMKITPYSEGMFMTLKGRYMHGLADFS